MSRKTTVPGGYRLFRLVTPSGNDAPISAVQSCLQNILGREPVSLEICIGGGGTKEYFVRLPASLRPEGLLPYLRGTYPQLAWQEVGSVSACPQRGSFGYVPAWFAYGETARYVAVVEETWQDL